MGAQLLTLPDRNIQDIPRALRALAEQVEKGQLGDCHNIAWVVDVGDGHVECGLLGAAPEAGPVAHLLFAKGMRALENG